jgi:hypothetical protein
VAMPQEYHGSVTPYHFRTTHRCIPAREMQ